MIRWRLSRGYVLKLIKISCTNKSIRQQQQQQQSLSRLCVMPLTFWLHFKTKAPTIRIFIALFPGDPLWPFWWLPRHRKGTFNSNVSKQLAEPVIPRFTIRLLLDPSFPRLLLYPAPDDVAPTKPLATSYSVWKSQKKVSFKIASEASYDKSLLKNAKNGQFGEILKNSNVTFWEIFKHCEFVCKTEI